MYWAAGFWDGEGYAMLRKAGHRPGRKTEFWYIRLQVAQVQLEPLERFMAAVDGGKIRGPYHHKQTHHNPYYLWTADKGARRIARVLIPMVCTTKREQLQSALDRDMHVNEEV